MSRTSFSLSPRTARFLLAWSTLLALVACGGSDREPRQVILLMLDAAVPDRFSAYGYPRETTPNLDRLAASGVVFTRHFAQGTHTRAALPPLFYSRYFITPIFPSSDKIPLEGPLNLFRTNDEQSISLPRAFSRAGFRTAAISAHTWLKEGTRFAREVDELHDLSTTLEYDPKYAHPRADQVIDQALRWIQRHRREDFFLYVHLMDTHFPHFFEDDARHFFEEESFGAGKPSTRRFRRGGFVEEPDLPLEGRDRNYLDALYDGSLRFTDRHIGRLLSALEDDGRLDKTAILVTADHGEHLLETPPRFAHGGPWFDRVGRIPLILHYPPKLDPGRYEGLTESVDVMPTLLGLMDVELPGGKRSDGIALSRALSGRLAPREFALTPGAIRGERYKVLFDDGDAVLLAEEPPEIEQLSGSLYDLEADPEERENLWSSHPEVIRRHLDAYRQRMSSPYQRFTRATTTAQPAEPFAIAANHFQVEPAAPIVPHDLTSRELSTRETETGWLRVHHWELYALLARGGGGPVRLEVPLPDGEYYVSAVFSGRFRAQLDDGRVIDLEPPPAATGPVSMKIGTVTVRGQRFGVTLTPGDLTPEDLTPGAGSGLHVFRRLGFVPRGGGSDANEEADRKREDRLRALGYIE